MDVADPGDGFKIGDDLVEFDALGDVLAKHGQDLSAENDGTHGDEHADRQRDDGVPDSVVRGGDQDRGDDYRSEEHTSELQSLMRISYAVFCLKKKTKNT